MVPRLSPENRNAPVRRFEEIQGEFPDLSTGPGQPGETNYLIICQYRFCLHHFGFQFAFPFAYHTRGQCISYNIRHGTEHITKMIDR